MAHPANAWRELRLRLSSPALGEPARRSAQRRDLHDASRSPVTDRKLVPVLQRRLLNRTNEASAINNHCRYLLSSTFHFASGTRSLPLRLPDLAPHVIADGVFCKDRQREYTRAQSGTPNGRPFRGMTVV